MSTPKRIPIALVTALQMLSRDCMLECVDAIQMTHYTVTKLRLHEEDVRMSCRSRIQVVPRNINVHPFSGRSTKWSLVFEQ